MKQLITILFLSILLNIYAQDEANYSIDFGITASTFSGTNTSINKLGLFGGVNYTWFSNPLFGGEVGLQFIQKGAFNPPDRDNGDNTFYKLTENYLQLPVSVLYYNKGITYMLGLAGGYLISFKEENERGVFPISAPFRKYELSAIGGVKIKLTNNILFKSALNQSLIPVKLYPSRGVRWYNRGHYNTSLILGINIKF